MKVGGGRVVLRGKGRVEFCCCARAAVLSRKRRRRRMKKERNDRVGSIWSAIWGF